MVVHWQGEKDTSVKIYTSHQVLYLNIVHRYHKLYDAITAVTAFQLILKFYYFKGFFEEMIDFQNSVQD